MYHRWCHLRYGRLRKIFNCLIMTLAFHFLISSGTLVGLLVYKLIQIMGTHDFLLWEIPFVVSILIFFSILM